MRPTPRTAPAPGTTPAPPIAAPPRATPALRTAPAPRTPSSHRLAATLTALLAVLLTLVPAGRPAAGAGLALPETVPAATTVPRPDTGFRADDGCATTCATQVRARHDHLGERPAPPDRLATATRLTGVAPAAHRRATAAPGSVPVSPGRTSHDRGRAPPASSGT
ncbi:hypothetical protein [Streptomyces mutabilis]|uniref:Uncharacterized protein n=1 Tax=Streptomyces mutabilis TaxID=67332 RepID=A0A086MVU5_9ACTN|nr:hypothetical protein [Streptomyces mutabilis]KFG73013.1 hypothetical protein FM21_19410 [Streptomyces mutabilis]